MPRPQYGILIACVISAFILGCAIPVPILPVVQPESTITVIDQQGRPVENAKFVVATAWTPVKIWVTRTGVDGQASLASARSLDIAFPFLPHGIKYYAWVWCVEKDGFVSVAGEASNVQRMRQIHVELIPGESQLCDPEHYFSDVGTKAEQLENGRNSGNIQPPNKRLQLDAASPRA